MSQAPSPIELRQSLRAQMAQMTDLLIAEFGDSHRAETVRRCVARCREHLLVSGVRHGLVPATEAAARLILRRTTPIRTAV